MTDWLFTDEAAELLGVRERTIYAMRDRGALRTVRLFDRQYCYSREEVEALAMARGAMADTRPRCSDCGCVLAECVASPDSTQCGDCYEGWPLGMDVLPVDPYYPWGSLARMPNPAFLRR